MNKFWLFVGKKKKKRKVKDISFESQKARMRIGQKKIREGDGTHSSTLAWEIQWTEEPVRLQSMGSQRVGYD